MVPDDTLHLSKILGDINVELDEAQNPRSQLVSDLLTEFGLINLMLYKVVAQTVILYGRKIWVVIGVMLKVLEGFHHQAARRIAGMTAWITEDGVWDYLPVADALESAGLWPIREYIHRRKVTILAQASFQEIYELCNGAEQMPGSSKLMRWWDQEMGRERE